MASELDPGFLAISLSDDDDSAPEAAEPKQPRIPGAARTGQSEEDFQAVRRVYKVKVENGEIWRSIKLPLNSRVTKPEAQAVLHAVEELYFFQRYAEGAAFVRKVLGDGGSAAGGLDEDMKKLLAHYEDRCTQRAVECPEKCSVTS